MLDAVVEIDVDAEIGVVVELLVKLDQLVLLFTEISQLLGQATLLGGAAGFFDPGGDVFHAGTELVLEFVQI